MRNVACVLVLLAACAVSSSPYQDSSSKDADPGPAKPAAATDKQDAAPTAAKNSGDHNWHFRLGTITAAGGYFGGPAYYPYRLCGYPDFYSAAFWDPFWGPQYPGYAPNFGYAHGKGEIKLTGAPKDAEIYIDGAYAGIAKDLKHVWLDAGAYDLSVVSPGREAFQQRIYVLSGKVLKIAAGQRPTTAD